jgi:hypothetical protein
MFWGAVMLAVSNTMPVYWQTFAGFLTHFLVIALARSLINGAASAYLYEYLSQNGEVDNYKAIEGKARSYSLVGRVVCWFGVGSLMKWQLTLPYSLSALTAFVACVVAYKMPAIRPLPSLKALPAVSNRVAFFRDIVAVAGQLKQTPLLILLMFQGAGIFILVRILEVNLFQPILIERHFDLAYFGWIMSLMTVCEAIGNRQATNIQKFVSNLTGVYLYTLVMSVSIIVIGFSGQVGAVAGLCMFTFASGLSFPTQKQLLNEQIKDARFRATILSIESIIDRSLCALLVLPLGGLVKSGKINLTLLICGLATMLAVSFIYFVTVLFNRRLALTSHPNHNL